MSEIKGGLDQYGAEHFGRLIFATVRKNVGLKGLIPSMCMTISFEEWLIMYRINLYQTEINLFHYSGNYRSHFSVNSQ